MKKVLIGAGILFAVIIGIGSFSHSPQPTAGLATDVSSAQGTPKQEPKIEVKQETSDEVVHYTSKSVDDPSLAKGQTRVTQAGVDGKITHFYSVTYTNSQETSRKETNTTRVDPKDQITAVGTMQPSPPKVTYPAGATAICADGTYSYSQNRRGTCSHHGGVAKWL